jgi:hypothetical protein
LRTYRSPTRRRETSLLKRAETWDLPHRRSCRDRPCLAPTSAKSFKRRAGLTRAPPRGGRPFHAAKSSIPWELSGKNSPLSPRIRVRQIQTRDPSQQVTKIPPGGGGRRPHPRPPVSAVETRQVLAAGFFFRQATHPIGVTLDLAQKRCVAARLSPSTTLPKLVGARVRRARAHFRIVYYFISSHV